jgi:phosphoesterase RecJ-like protein
MKDRQKAIFKLIKAYTKIIIMPHARPDGDCMGSAFGLKGILQASFPDKTIYVVGEETEYLHFLGRTDHLEDSDFEGALIIAVDTANLNRLGDPRYALGERLIKIDHHIDVAPYGEVSWVDTSAPAVAQMIVEFYQTFQKKLTCPPEAALALYTGILTDTGRFKYAGVSERTFQAVATLYRIGVDAQVVHTVLDTKSEPLVRFKGYILLNYQKTENGVAYIKITEALRQEHGVSMEEASSLVNELGVFEDSPIWVLLAEYEEAIVRARIRSKGPRIDDVANQFEGGGHMRASGANVGTWDKAEDLLNALDARAKEYKAQTTA